MLYKSKLVAIRRGCVLLGLDWRTGEYTLPGGTALRGESPIQTLRREVKQELPGLTIISLRRHWGAPLAPFIKNKEITVYFAQVRGILTGGAEIRRGYWIRNWKKLHLSRSTRRILRTLEARGYFRP